MLRHQPLLIEAHDVDDHHLGQQLMQDDEVPTGEQLDRAPLLPARPMECNGRDIVVKAFPPLADTRCMLNVVLRDIAVDQRKIIAMHAIRHEIEHGFLVSRVFK